MSTQRTCAGPTSVSLSRQARAKLAALAQATGRSRSSIVEQLIRMARATGNPDLALEGELQPKPATEPSPGGQGRGVPGAAST